MTNFKFKVVVAYTDGSHVAGVGDHSGGTGSGIHAYAYNVPPTEQHKLLCEKNNVKYIEDKVVPVLELSESIGDEAYSNIPKKDIKNNPISINDLELTLIELSWPQFPTTANVGELNAFIALMTSEIEADKYYVYVDSTYLMDPINKGWLSNWKKNNWTNSSGAVKNKELWVKIDEIMAKNGKKVEIRKIKGHSGRLGNDLADNLAGLGSNTAINEINREGHSGASLLPKWTIEKYTAGAGEVIVEDVTVGNRKPKKVKDEEKFIPTPLRQKYLYGYGGEKTPVVELQGEQWFRFYGGDHAKVKDDRLLLGKAYPDSIQYVTFMQNDCTTVSDLINECHERTWEGVPLMYRCNLVYMINGTFVNQQKFNRRFIDNKSDFSTLTYLKDYNELMFDENNWVVVANKPPMLSYRAMDLSDTLTNWYKDFLDTEYKGNKKYGVKDITNQFFILGKPTKFYRDIDKFIKLMAPVPGTDKEIDVILPKNIAIPERRYLNSLAKEGDLKIYLVTRRETKNAFKFFIVLETEDFKQLIISYYSSLRIHG